MRLLTAVAVVLLPAYAFRLVWLVATDGTGRVADGVLTFDGQSWVAAIVTSLIWATAVFLGVAVLDGGPRPLGRSLRALPAIAGLVALLGILLAIAFVILDAILPASPLTVVLVAAGLGIAASAIAMPVLLGVTGAIVCGTVRPVAVDLTGQRWRIGARLAIGVVVPFLLVSVIVNAVGPAGRLAGIAAAVFSTAALAACAAIQSVALFNVYLHTAPGTELAPRARPSRWVATAGVLAVFVPAGFSAAVAAAADLPSITRTEVEIGHIMAIGWPSGRHPVIVGQEKILDCLDDACTRYTTTQLGVAMYEPNGNAVIRPDGNVYAFGQAELEICDPQRHCEAVRGNGLMQRFGYYPSAATLAVGPDGNPVIAAIATADKEHNATLTLHRCSDRLCTTSHATELGTVQYLEEDRWDRRVILLEVGIDGRAVVAVREPGGHVRLFGEASPQQRERMNFAIDGSIERPGGGWYAVATEHTGQPVLFQAGTPDSITRSELLLCPDRTCDRPERRIPIEAGPRSTSNWPPPLPEEIWMIAVGSDGRLALIRPQQIPKRLYIVTP